MYNKILSACTFSLLLILPAVTSCRKEKSYVYGVKDVTVSQEGSLKPNVKTTTEFISIAYADIFGTSISNADLVKLSTAYSSFGDRKLIEDMVIRNFLNRTTPPPQVPAKASMTADVGKFVSDTYKKFYNRSPNEYEKWFVTNLIKSDTSVTPELVYYSFLTSNEYRYY